MHQLTVFPITPHTHTVVGVLGVLVGVLGYCWQSLELQSLEAFGTTQICVRLYVQIFDLKM